MQSVIMKETYMNSKKQILVVDDNEMIQSALALILSANGFAVEVCSNGSYALTLSKKRPFELYIVDYRLPDMKGDFVTAEIRKSQPDSIIIGSSVETEEQAFLAAGADKFILKENLTTELLKSIAAVTSHSNH